MREIAGLVLWGCAGLILYTYAGYPLFLAALARLSKGRPDSGAVHREEESALPPVSLIVPVYNEEQVIERKIRNSCELDYPESLLEIVVVSDGSNDATEPLARQAAGDRVRVHFLADRRGKTACLNAVLPTLRGEIVVFTDANAFFYPQTLRTLVRPLRDPTIGCVMGELEYLREASLNALLGEGLYWRYENFIKEQESRLGSTIVGNGAIYAMRRSLCRTLPAEVEADVANPLLVLAQGHRVIFERRARCFERASATVREEFSRKSRIITNQIASYLYGRKAVRPLPASALFQILSHKALRWFVPFLLLGLLAASAGRLDSPFSALLFILQLAFYSLALVGWFLEGIGVALPRALFVPYYFCAVNAASVTGIADFMRGRRWVIWEKAASTR